MVIRLHDSACTISHTRRIPLSWQTARIIADHDSLKQPETRILFQTQLSEQKSKGTLARLRRRWMMVVRPPAETDKKISVPFTLLHGSTRWRNSSPPKFEFCRFDVVVPAGTKFSQQPNCHPHIQTHRKKCHDFPDSDPCHT